MFRLKRRALLAGWGESIGALLIACVLCLPATAWGQVLPGDLSGELYGHSVAWAGDVDGDGNDDFLIGAPLANTGNGRSGRVELYLGRYGYYPTTPDRVYEGDVAGDEFGFAVSTAGDLNGDGYDDFLVGAPANDGAGINAGRVYLFLGSSSAPSQAAYHWDGDLPNGRFAEALAGGFDFNNDDLGDFAVGAPNRTDTQGGGLRAGMVRIYFGASNAAGVQQPFTFTGEQANWSLGFSMDPAGDLDDDGYDDLAVGAPQMYDFNPGRVVVLFGQASTFFPPDRLDLVGELGADKFGWDVSGAGDLNGDGYDDLVVGAPDHDASGIDRGAIYVFEGGSSFDGSNDWKAVGGQGGDRLGIAVDGDFDISGDDVPDLIAGSPGANHPAAGSGEVRVYFGGSSMNPDGDLSFGPTAPVPSFEAGDAFGSAVRFVGSFNGYSGAGDSDAEFLASAPTGNSSLGGDAGYVNFIVNPDSYTPVRVLSFTAEASDRGCMVRWNLSQADALAGVKVQAVRDDVLIPLHSGWLAPDRGSFEDPEVNASTTAYRLLALDREGTVSLLATAAYSGATARVGLGAPDRNPFRDRVAFRADLPAGPVRVVVWDVRGREVRVLLARPCSGESLELSWDGRDAAGNNVPAGVYIVTSESGSRRAALKLVRLP